MVHVDHMTTPNNLPVLYVPPVFQVSKEQDAFLVPATGFSATASVGKPQDAIDTRVRGSTLYRLHFPVMGRFRRDFCPRQART